MSNEFLNEGSIAKRKCKRIQKVPTDKLVEIEQKWTYDEKVELYNSLLKYGSSNIALIAQTIPKKTEEAIRNYINNFKKVSRSKLKDSSRKAPIDKWLEFIVQKDTNYNEHLTDISCALKFIALYEPRFKNGNMNLGDCYQVLSDCLCGEVPKHINPETSLFLFDNIQKLAKLMKNENKTSEEDFLEKCLKLKEIRCYSGKRKAVNKVSGINPLNIPDPLLMLKK